MAIRHGSSVGKCLWIAPTVRQRGPRQPQSSEPAAAMFQSTDKRPERKRSGVLIPYCFRCVLSTIQRAVPVHHSPRRWVPGRRRCGDGGSSARTAHHLNAGHGSGSALPEEMERHRFDMHAGKRNGTGFGSSSSPDRHRPAQRRPGGSVYSVSVPDERPGSVPGVSAAFRSGRSRSTKSRPLLFLLAGWDSFCPGCQCRLTGACRGTSSADGSSCRCRA